MRGERGPDFIVGPDPVWGMDELAVKVVVDEVLTRLAAASVGQGQVAAASAAAARTAASWRVGASAGPLR